LRGREFQVNNEKMIVALLISPSGSLKYLKKLRFSCG
jgi:hypothetical protein